MTEAYYPYLETRSPFYVTRPQASRDNVSRRYSPPENWYIHEDEEWEHHYPNNVELPIQGWKIHLSASLGDSEWILEESFRIAYSLGVPLKFRPSPGHLMRTNAKYAERINAGKFITMYPSTLEQCDAALQGLLQATKTATGPQILSDLRLYDSVVHVRHGAFVKLQTTSIDGATQYNLIGQSGELELDDRAVFKELPTGVPAPETILAAYDSYLATDVQLPFEATAALAYPNGGGVFKAEYEGRECIVKEGRRHAGLDATGVDAYTRVMREHHALELAQSKWVPQVLGLFQIKDRAYLAQEYIDGINLSTWVTLNCPLINAGATTRDRQEYLRRCSSIMSQLHEASANLTRLGIAHNDLQPANILISNDDSVRLIDFEASTTSTGDRDHSLGTPGFADPNLGTGTSQDSFALQRIALHLVNPAVSLLDINGDAKSYLREELLSNYTQGINSYLELYAPTNQSSTVNKASRTLPGLPKTCDPKEPTNSEYARIIRRRLMDGINESTQWMPDARFPGDIAQAVSFGKWNILTGAAGVLVATNTNDLQLRKRNMWREDLLEQTKRSGDYPVGLLNGRTGIISALANEDGFDPSCLEESLQKVKLDLLAQEGRDCTLASGAAGVLLAMESIPEEHGLSSDLAGEVFEVAATKLWSALPDLLDADDGNLFSQGRSFIEGRAGIAFAICSSDSLSGREDDTLQDKVRTLLDNELKRFEEVESDGSLQLLDRRRYLPYLGRGSIGMAVALLSYRRRFQDSRYDATVKKLAKVLQVKYTVVGGLLYGRSGLLWLSSVLPRWALPQDRSELIRAHLEGVGGRSIELDTGIALAGEHNLRCSVDLATGSSGAMIAIEAAKNALSHEQESTLDLEGADLRSWLPLGNRKLR